MKPIYTIEYYNDLWKTWIRHNFINYSSLQKAKDEVKSYKNHKLGIKIRIVKTEIIK